MKPVLAVFVCLLAGIALFVGGYFEAARRSEINAEVIEAEVVPPAQK